MRGWPHLRRTVCMSERRFVDLGEYSNREALELTPGTSLVSWMLFSGHASNPFVNTSRKVMNVYLAPIFRLIELPV